MSFEEAVTVWADGDALAGPDLRHSLIEPRFYLVGRSALGRMLSVTYTVRSRADGETFRLITARPASRKERLAYNARD